MVNCNYGSVLVGLAVVLGVGASAGCGSDSGTGNGAQTAGAGGSVAGAGGTGISGGGSSGAPAAGASTGGASTAAGGASGSAAGGTGGSAAGAGGTTAGAGGATAGAGGAAAGSGGAAAGSGGAAAGSAGAGGSAVTFAAVSAIINKSCTLSGCHDGTNTHVNYKTNLYSVLTTPLPTGTDRCVGSTLVAPSNTAGSFLLTAIKTGGACQKGGSSIGRMPDNCSASANAQNPCLSDAQVQTITAWITAGAPM